MVVHLAREASIDIDVLAYGEKLVFRPRGVLWFASSRIVEDAFAAALAANPRARQVEISLRGIGRMDLTGALALRRILQDARAASLDVQVTGMPPRANRWTRSLIRSDLEPL
jgi:anti-anti-sigma regulatory factor